MKESPITDREGPKQPKWNHYNGIRS